MKGTPKAQHDAIMARLRREGRLDESGQVRLVSLAQAHDARKRDEKTATQRRSAASTKPILAKSASGAVGQLWRLEGLYKLFDAAGFSREAADKALAEYQRGYFYDKQNMGPFLLHEPFVRAALERGENVPRNILELHPRLLPEANILHGVTEGSRDATLLHEARKLQWIGYNESREHFHKDGRWWLGTENQSRDPKGAVGRTAKDALALFWKRRPGPHRKAGVVDEGGPWTVAEQRKRLENEKKRLAKLYAELKLKAPRVPTYEEVVVWEREQTLARVQEIAAGIKGDTQTLRGNLRDANKYGLRRQQELDEARLWKALPEDHPDRPRRFSGEPNTAWANENLRDAFKRAGYSKPETIQAVLADSAFMDSLDPYVVARFQKFLNDRGPDS